MITRSFFQSGCARFLYFSGALFVAGILLSVQSFTGNENDQALSERMPVMYESFLMPDQLEFAGEPVPLDNFDTREASTRKCW